MFSLLSASIHESRAKSVAKRLVRIRLYFPSILIPWGIIEIVRPSLWWYRFVPDPITFSVPCVILRVCRFLIVPIDFLRARKALSKAW
ncbi:hypothetical protein GALMADRAFT_700835 [Galerina marginata CBS 339.88]|uniref:Uncharacterized protein n=1 Tax=Galerina marginata (strain CBS 339.88) TaxID=685588 RepID=A0A067TYM0_GALM3|nr:hypothetical protein GALMADRAFT_700835 [Galerina marginata CBS 339.88]